MATLSTCMTWRGTILMGPGNCPDLSLFAPLGRLISAVPHVRPGWCWKPLQGLQQQSKAPAQHPAQQLAQALQGAKPLCTPCCTSP